MSDLSQADLDYILSPGFGPAPTPAPKVSAPAPAPKRRANPFDETLRAVLGGLRDNAQGTLDAIDDIAAAGDAWVYRKTGMGTYAVYGKDARNGVFELVPKAVAEQRTGRAAGFNAKAWMPKVEENRTGVGRIARDIVEFGSGFAGGSRALRGLAAVGTVGRVSRPVLAGAVAAFESVDPMQGNLANMAKQLGVPKNALMEALAVDEDDDALVARFKNAATDAVSGVAMDAAFKTLATGVRQLRGLRAAKESVQRQAAIPEEALRHAPELDQQAAEAVAPKITQAEPKPAPKPEPAPGEQMSLFPDAPAAAKPAQVDELEQTLFSIPKTVQGLSDDAVRELAQAYHAGKDYTVLERLGLNPARIDFAKVLADDVGVDRVNELVERIAEATQPLAMEAGSKPRSWSQTAMLANLVGTSEGQVVAAFKGRTNMLDAYAWSARQLLGGSAARLTALAEQAKAFVNDPTHPSYTEFLKALEAHSALQAQFKAATSNLGRALNSLKGTATAKNAAERAARIQALAPDVAVPGVQKGAQTAEDALRALGDAKSPKERQLLIDKIIRAKGDTAKLTQLAERYSGPTRWQRAVREYITGNLFSVGTGVVNILSTAGHIGFRALARMPVHGLAYASGKAGGKEYVAARLAETAYFNTLIPAFARGAQQVFRLLADDLTEEVQGLAGSFGSNKVEAKLGTFRQWMDNRWGAYRPRFERADAIRAKEWRVSKEQIDQLMDNTDQLPALLRLGFRGLVGVGTGAFNLVGTASRAVRLATIDVTDELFGTVAEHSTRASEAARIAALEGFDRGLSGKALADYTRQRADVLLKNSSTELVERAERLVALGARPDSDEVFELASEAARSLQIETVSREEAQKLLFQDDLNWELSRSAARFLPKMDARTGLIFPFIKTPMKILETTLGEYTPLGLLQRETRDRLMSGGVDAQVAISQMALGTLSIASAVALAQAGYVVGFDGGPRSSTRMERPQYSMKIGNKWVEFSRFDPFGMLLGLGADVWEQTLQQDLGDDDKATDSGFGKAFTGMALAINRNILSKTWLTSARDIIALVSSQSDEQAEAALERLANSTTQKFVPAGGFVRWWEGTDTGVLREAQTTWERVMQSTPWADELPVKRDPLLGRPVQYNRILGIQAGTEGADPVIDELADLNFDLPPDASRVRGVDLTSAQKSRLKELRGQIVTDRSGLTFEQSLREMIAAPEWAEMDRKARLRAIQSLREDYQDLAVDALREEDKQFDYDIGSVRLRRQLEKQGYAEPEISAELQRFKEEVFGP